VAIIGIIVGITLCMKMLRKNGTDGGNGGKGGLGSDLENERN